MAKIKYYQLAINEAGHTMLFVSPNQAAIDQAVSDGYTVKGYDGKADIPANPILDNGEVREMTAAEITAAVNARKLARTVFTKLEIREAFKSLDNEAALDALLNGNATFKTYWLEAENIDLNHPVTVQALSSFTAAEIEALKLTM